MWGWSMRVTASGGNADLDAYTRRVPTSYDTGAYDKVLERQFESVKAKLLGRGSSPEPIIVKLPPFPEIVVFAEIKARLADPNVEPQFNIPDVIASMGMPKNFSLFPNGQPSPHDVNQSGVGDCYLDALLGSLAAQNPDFVKNMVRDNGDGTYTVRLFAPNGEPVDVTVNSDVPLDSKGDLVGVRGPNNQANWASIIEKAFAKYNDEFHIVGQSGHTGYAALNDGSINNDFYRALTGVTATSRLNSSYSTAAEQDDLAREMKRAIEDRRTVYTGSPKEQILPDGRKLAGPHAYSVLAVNQDANGDWYVEVRNPWGSTPGGLKSEDGIIRMSISDYVKYMDNTTIGDKPIAGSGNNPTTWIIPPPPSTDRAIKPWDSRIGFENHRLS